MAKYSGGVGVAWRFRVATIFFIGGCCMWSLVTVAAETGATAAQRERAAALRSEIARHDELYFKRAAPEIGDQAYDQLKRELRALAAGFPELRGDAAGAETVGDDRAGTFGTRRHGEKMLSLDKARTEAEVRAFAARATARLAGRPVVWIVEPKYDGLAISATYERGRLVRVVTRGNGFEGDDVTANALALGLAPRELRRAEGEAADAASETDGTGAVWPEKIELRGEAYMTWAEFERINRACAAEGEPLFANPRNLAAGTLKLADASELARRGRGRRLEAVFYGWGEVAPAGAAPATQRAFHERAKAWGLPGVASYREARDGDGLCAEIRAVERARSGLGFPIDGVVVKLDEAAARAELGAAEHAPRWAMAFKFEAERAATRVRGITVQVGRSGVLTPVAELAPVRLAGSTVARATLHNRDEIARRDVRVGDRVWIEKAGDIIPAVVEVDRAGRTEACAPFVFPVNCPVCGTAVAAGDEAAAVRCPNRRCAAQVEARLRHFASKPCLDIGGLGEKTVAALVRGGRVKNPADFYRLRRDELSTVEGLGAKAAEALLREIAESRRRELGAVILGLGIPRIGAVASRELAGSFGSLTELAELGAAGAAGKAGADAGATTVDTPAAQAPTTPMSMSEGFSRVPGLGEAQRRALAEFLSDDENRRLLRELAEFGVGAGVGMNAEPGKAGEEKTVAERPGVAGKTFVLTGTLRGFTRAEAEAVIVAAGGRVSGTVGATTDFVVVGEKPGEKAVRAKERGVAVLDEEGFAELFR